MENISAPALLAYKGGDVFATIVEIANQLPNGRDCSTSSLEDLLMQYVFTPPPLSLSHILFKLKHEYLTDLDRYRVL
jgi:hypothetical protein